MYDFNAYQALLQKEGFSYEAIDVIIKMVGEKNFVKFCRAGKFKHCHEYFDTLDALDDLGIPLPEIGAVPYIGTVRERALDRLNELKKKFDILFGADCLEKHVVIYWPSLKKLDKAQEDPDFYDMIEP